MSSYYLCDTCGYFVRSDFDVWLCDIIPRLPRRVAARLRKKYGERHGTFEPQCIEIQASNRMDDLLDCLPKRRDMLLDLADFIEPEPERTCRIEYVKHGPFFDVLRFSCCGYEWAENRTDPGATEPDPNFCPNCGARVKEGE